MSTVEKLKKRFLSYPKDYSWEELTKLLAHFGYKEIKSGKTGGSRRKFADEAGHVIALHKPHPANIVKHYALKQVAASLKEKGYLKDE